MTDVLDRFAEQRLNDLAAAGLLRRSDDGSRRLAVEQAAARLGLEPIDASSNDYLGLGRDVSRETRVQVGVAGAGASRLIQGTRRAHLALEAALARWVGAPTSLLFTSGYSANVGVLSTLGVDGSVIFSDQLNHASIVDGCRLSRARVEIVPHLDLSALELGLGRSAPGESRWVVTESCFSMDGDGPDLRALRDLCDRYAAALIVDEAHALGVFGPRGAGRCAEAGVVPDALVGTLGKAVGTQGAFVAGSASLRELLWNKARSFVFSTATSPLLAEVTLLHVERTQADDTARSSVFERARALRARLAEHGVEVPPGLGGPIVPIVVGENHLAMRVAERLESRGILSQAIRPPTVSAGSARVRLTVTASWPPGAVDRVAEAVAEALRSST